jgi:hypothetical protein
VPAGHRVRRNRKPPEGFAPARASNSTRERAPSWGGHMPLRPRPALQGSTTADAHRAPRLRRHLRRRQRNGRRHTDAGCRQNQSHTRSVKRILSQRSAVATGSKRHQEILGSGGEDMGLRRDAGPATQQRNCRHAALDDHESVALTRGRGRHCVNGEGVPTSTLGWSARTL